MYTFMFPHTCQAQAASMMIGYAQHMVASEAIAGTHTLLHSHRYGFCRAVIVLTMVNQAS